MIIHASLHVERAKPQRLNLRDDAFCARAADSNDHVRFPLLDVVRATVWSPCACADARGDERGRPEEEDDPCRLVACELHVLSLPPWARH